MAGIDFAAALNAEQRDAVMGPDGPILVLAAAGTGKTRTLVYRVARLVEQGIPPSRILLLTFTNRAAREMLARAHVLVGGGVSDLWGGTFHHMANRILRRHAKRLGYPNDYTILDRDDARSLLRHCVDERKLRDREFPKPEVLLALWGAAANTATPIERIVAARFADFPADMADILRVLREYDRRKRAAAAMDFDDLLVNGLQLLREHPPVLDEYQERFRHVLVDEYQDTNAVQAELVDRLAARHRNVFVVGDDFQCIYTWRGANFANIMTFSERYADARLFTLETNYRSMPGILAVANACIAGNPRQYQKTLRATRPGSQRPVLAFLADGEHQAGYVVEQIRRLLRAGVPPSEIAVLYRAHFHAMELQLLLTRARVPYLITSGVRFFEQAHIKDVCSLLRMIHNPLDGVSFARLLGLLPRVGPQTALKLWAKAGQAFRPLEAAARAALAEGLPAPARAGWKDIAAIFEAYGPEELAEDPGEVIHRFVEAYYEHYATDTFDDAARRLEDIEELVLYTAKFGSVEEFLTDVALVSNADSEADSRRNEENSVRLSTVHQAKGLEWKAVIVLWVTEGMFPSSRSLAESDEGESEERRLFYVALTRAKDELLLCVPARRRTSDGGVMDCRPSRFVEEIPAHLFRDVRAGRF